LSVPVLSRSSSVSRVPPRGGSERRRLEAPASKPHEPGQMVRVHARRSQSFPPETRSKRRQAPRKKHPPPGAPDPQSQSLSRRYGSGLPTSLAHILPSTRGCSPWRPDADVSTTRREAHSLARVFKGHRGRTGRRRGSAALYPARSPLSGQADSGAARVPVRERRKLLPGSPLTSPSSHALPLWSPRPRSGMLTGCPFGRGA